MAGRNRRTARSLTGDTTAPVSMPPGPGAAQYQGICVACDQPIAPGHAIRRTRRGYVHRLCGSGGDDE